MKKVIIIFISIVICLFLLVIIMVSNNNRYINDMKKEIIDNTEIKEVDYVNKYDNNYIVMDSEYLYLVSNDFNILKEVELSMIYENKNSYDIIYKDNQIMYFNDKYEDDKLMYEYFDIYTYELIDRVIVGG